MSLYDALGAIGGGLRVAGATLSPQYAATAAQQDENQKNRDEQKKRFLAELLTQHYQQGTLDAPSYQQAMGKLGMDIPQIQPQPDYSGAASQVTQQLDQGSFLPGGGLRPQPTAPAVRPDGTKPMPVQSVDAKPIGQDELTADIDVPGKVQVYSPEEINLATAKYAESIKGGTIQQRNKAVKDFRDNLKAERKSQLDEMEKTSLITKRDYDMANEKQPAFIKELKYFAKMKPDDPGYKFMLERLTMDSNGKPTAARKNIEADLRSQGLKEGTEQWDEEFHRRMGAYLTKQTTPKANQAQATQLTKEAIGPLAFESLLFGKNPPGMGTAASSQRAEVANERARIGHALGLSDIEIAMLPQDNKVKMKAVDKLTTWGAFVDKAGDQLAKTIDIAMAYAERIGPGKLKALNQAIIAGEKHFNDPDANAYALQVNSIRLEYGRLMAGPTSNAMLPVEAMKKGDDLISTGFDMPSWKEIKIAVMRDASVTKNAVKGQRDALLGSIKNPGQKEAPQKVDLPGGKGSDVPLHAPEVKNPQGNGTSAWKIEEIK